MRSQRVADYSSRAVNMSGQLLEWRAIERFTDSTRILLLFYRLCMRKDHRIGLSSICWIIPPHVPELGCIEHKPHEFSDLLSPIAILVSSFLPPPLNKRSCKARQRCTSITPFKAVHITKHSQPGVDQVSIL